MMLPWTSMKSFTKWQPARASQRGVGGFTCTGTNTVYLWMSEKMLKVCRRAVIYSGSDLHIRGPVTLQVDPWASCVWPGLCPAELEPWTGRALCQSNGTLCSLSATLWRETPIVSWRIGSGRPRSEAGSDLWSHKCHSWAIWFWGQIRKCHVPVVVFPQLGIEPRTFPVVSKRLTTRHTFWGAMSLFKAFI